MEKLEKSVVPSARQRIVFLLAGFLAVSVLMNTAQCGFARDGQYAYDLCEINESLLLERSAALRFENAELELRLEEMTKTAGAYRAYGVYDNCVQQTLGIYQMEEVARAYDRHFRSTETTAKCLAESEWYETHPIGINPAHMSR